ncbi:MAG: hypothetical protein WCX23_03295 [Candidatus Paceibacterota bacterium]|jgi:hypothetical protein|nr:hypothetical protein [Candidatus Paceibacterota bacterium]MDD4830930.1 hypothetical protein [Candidatus Paceibacterota bacterium]MDD4875217.1 hypothetical protein [Candidatus Paceibacterota bacterium]
MAKRKGAVGIKKTRSASRPHKTAKRLEAKKTMLEEKKKKGKSK